ncbi:hypothetical protein BS47DRAFT_1306972 [Hydnum rufescens UP504]|uniref:Uncharacterized protein n=1 Tax=Hydnum rufescens UP504 TaxID=1448309 RepID=A0A9P6AGA9_9AGAM|nr:hypothetical protein BS47DRAFT_1306972 [Hydnum rufescens UP504]
MKHLQLLRSRIISHAECPPTDFRTEPWNAAKLITPRHGVQMEWNYASTREHC